jgi:hypothetical protein
MEVSFQELFNIALAFILMLVGWLLRAGWGLIRDLQTEISDNKEKSATDIHGLSTKVTEEYVRKDDLQHIMDRIEGMVSKIIDKLDSKVDK